MHIDVTNDDFRAFEGLFRPEDRESMRRVVSVLRDNEFTRVTKFARPRLFLGGSLVDNLGLGRSWTYSGITIDSTYDPEGAWKLCKEIKDSVEFARRGTGFIKRLNEGYAGSMLPSDKTEFGWDIREDGPFGDRGRDYVIVPTEIVKPNWTNFWRGTAEKRTPIYLGVYADENLRGFAQPEIQRVAS